MNSTRSFILLIATIWLGSCAQIRPLSGGAKDVTAPELLMVQPPQLTTNFSSQQITFYFDEYIQLNNINQELVVSPPLLSPPKIRIKQKSLVMTLNERLLSNTTYTFNFGDGVADLNEGNKMSDLVYVISTGSDIDSLSLVGKLTDAYTGAAAPSYRILMFDNDTSVFAKKPRPVYVGKTKSDGSFLLNYLHEGSYFVYALKDENSNYRWDDEESGAFAPEPVTPAVTDSMAQLLYASTPRPRKPLINKIQTDSLGYMSLDWDPFFGQLTARLASSDREVSARQSADSTYFFIRGEATDRVEQLIITNDKGFADTLKVPFFSKVQKRSFTPKVEIGKKIKTNDPLRITAKTWMHIAGEGALLLKNDTLVVPCALSESGENDNYFQLKATLLAGKNYELWMYPGLLQNEAGATNDTVRVSFSTYKTEELGKLTFKLTGAPLPAYALFLLQNKAGERIAQQTNLGINHVLQVEGLLPGEYTARIIMDENANELFDPADPQAKRQPERVINFSDKIVVRANWEQVLTWELE